jgi:serine/threonine protein kinase
MSANATTDYNNELPVGYRLEEFEIRSVLGSGGFGITYLAYDMDLKREVVVKENLPFQCAIRDSTRSVRPRTSAISDKDAFQWALNSFMREAETLSHFDHPNIVRVLRRFEANNTAYFIMPYLPGKSLKQVIEEQVTEGKAFTEPKLKELLMPLLDALEALHAEGVYHRDIKAANILLGKGHKPILIDFGAARQFISEKSHTIVESAGYTPFEQLQSHGNVGPWSDIYALAATFYTAIHGEPPPRASDRIRRDPAVKLAEVYYDVYSRPFLEALDWALRVDETERPQSVAQWREALNGAAPAGRSATPPALPKKAPAEQEEVYLPPLDPTKEPVGRPKTPLKTPPVLTPKPRQPSKPFPWGFVLKISGGVVAALLLLGIALYFAWPYIAKPGSLKVTSLPPGATVQIKDQPDAKTPANYPSLRIGKYQVTVALPNYDPVTLNIEIKEGAAYPLDPVQLNRTMGTLNLTTDTTAKDYEGTAPVTLENIPAGSYHLTVSSSGLGTHTESIDVAGHQVTKQVADLIKLNLSDDDTTPAEKALLGETAAAQLTASDKSDYVQLLTRAITSYLHYNMFPQAEEQVAALKALGQDTADQEKKIAALQDSFVKSTGEQVQDLISDGKFGAAASKIKAFGDAMGKDAEDQLTTKYQGALTAYQQQAATAIKQAQSGDPAAGYDQLKAFAENHDDDVNLQLALGDLLRKLPPDHDRLGARVTEYKDFSTQYLGSEESGEFQDMQGRLVNEYNTFNDLLAKLNRAKNGPAALTKRIGDLQDAIAENQREINHSGGGVGGALNAVASFFGSHPTTNADRRAAIAHEQTELDQDLAEQQNPQADVTGAQDEYNAFCAKVPW